MKRFTQIFSFLAFLFLGITTSSAQCTVDCVWPGDANNNGIANNIDFLFSGLVEGTGGPSRIVGEQGVDWSPKTAPDWTNSFPSGINHKHADANGDGWIDGADLYAVTDVFNNTNASFSGLMGNVIPGNDLFLEFSDSIIEAGDTITIDVHLGSSTNVINNLHGIAFSIDFDTSKIVESETTIDFHGGWLGTPFVDLYTFSKYNSSADPERAYFAATRGNMGTVSGFGDILQIIVITEDDLAGKMEGIITSIEFDFGNVLGLDSAGTDMNITTKAGTLDVSDGIVGIKNFQLPKLDLQIYPNPTSGTFTIALPLKENGLSVHIYNVLGQKVYNSTIQDTEILVSTEAWNKGVFFIKVEDELGNLIATDRLVVR